MLIGMLIIASLMFFLLFYCLHPLLFDDVHRACMPKSVRLVS